MQKIWSQDGLSSLHQIYFVKQWDVEIKCKGEHNKTVDFNIDPYGLDALFLPLQVKSLERRV